MAEAGWRFTRRRFDSMLASALGSVLLALPPALRSQMASADLKTAADATNTLDDAIAAAAGFLGRQYDSSVGLLREAPLVAPNRFWLMNDNAVAMLVLDAIGEVTLASQVRSTIRDFGCLSANGSPDGIPLAVLWGKVVEWPPRSYTYTRIVGEPAGPFDPTTVCYGASCQFEVCVERWDGEGRFDDWSLYANLATLCALNEQLKGNGAIARQIFATTLATFDGWGFPDLAYRSDSSHRYETFKLALALYVGLSLRALDSATRDALAEALLAKQHGADATTQAGGFYTHFTATDLGGSSLSDVNTETTSLAALALTEYRADLGRSRVYLPLVARGPAHDSDQPPTMTTVGD